MKLIVNICFIVFLFGLSINQVFNFINTVDDSENRTLSEKPIFNIKELDKYPVAYDAFLNDHFSGRSYFLDFYKYISDHFFYKRTVSGKYLRGRDFYIFETSKNLPLYTGKRSVTEEQMDRIITEFKKRHDYLNKKGIKLYIEIIPSKFKVYSDKLPLLITKGNNHMGDRFIKRIQEETNIPIIDGLNILLEKKKKAQLYYKYDTHWNSLGSFYVHQELFKKIHEDFENIALLDSSYFHIDTFNYKKGNLRKAALIKEDIDIGYHIRPKNKSFAKAYGYVHPSGDFRYGQKAYCKRFVSSHNKAPKALVFRDFFANLSHSFLPEMFSEAIFIWDNWQYKFNQEIIDIEQPDIVIYSMYESYIDRILEEPSFVKADAVVSDIQ